MIRVGVNGFGTIGKRVADAVRAQPDMRVAGVAKRSPNYEAEVARDRGYALYGAGADGAAQFEDAGLSVAGDVEDLVEAADVVVDTTPSGVGAGNVPLYDRHDTPAVLQGGEAADVAPASFTARANYEEAVGADAVRVVSCNTTGLARLVAPLEEHYGVESVRATLVRRGGDPAQSDRGPINDTLPDPVAIPSHHGPDVRTIFPDLDITTMGLKVPSTLMHTHAIHATLSSDPDTGAVRDLLAGESRLVLLPDRLGIDGAGKITEYASDVGRPRGDVWENCIWTESVTMDGRELYLFQAIHQESDVVPENVDAIRALTDAASREASVARTNEALGIDVGFSAGGSRPDRAPNDTPAED